MFPIKGLYFVSPQLIKLFLKETLTFIIEISFSIKMWNILPKIKCLGPSKLKINENITYYLIF